MAKPATLIVVLFRMGFPAEEIRRIVKEQGCKLHGDHDGSSHAAVVEIPRGKKVVDYMKRFEKLEHEVKMVFDSDETVAAAQIKKIPA